MAIPTYQDLMLPLLRLTSDGAPHQLSDAIASLARAFSLTEQQQTELLPSGRQPIFHNRVGWARTYLKKAGLISSPQRGIWVITERGLDLLQENPQQITDSLLKRYPEFLEFKNPKTADEESVGGEEEESAETPEELLERAYQKLKLQLAQDLLQAVRGSSPVFFETLVVELLVRMGYGGSLRDAGQALGKSGDGGVDGVIKEDKLGLDVIYVQAKRWEDTVGRPIVQAFAGSLEGFRANKGVMLTTSQYSADARDYVTRIGKKIVLIDGPTLANLMMEYGVGVTPIAKYELWKLDQDYFSGDGVDASS